MDEELANLESARVRAAKFGKLPARTNPENTVEMVETAPPQDRPAAAGTEEQRQVFLAGG